MTKSSAMLGTILLAVGVAMALPRPAEATLVYATSIVTNSIYTDDSVTHVVTPVLNTGAAVDSLLFDPAGRIIYSQYLAGTVLAYNPITSSNVVLASGLNQPIDLALEPSLTSVLTSVSASNSLARISLAGGVIGAPLPVNGRPDGMIYDSAGRLFLNVSSAFQSNNTFVEQLNPVTGAILAQTANTGVFLDGLTYDSFTGFLYASDYNNGRIAKINPTTLAFSFLTPTGQALSQPDGITSDGAGSLFIASRNNSFVIQYNIAANTDTVIGTIAGLDDLAPASGLGAPGGVPEPASAIVAAMGVLALAGYAGKRPAPPGRQG